MILLKTFYSCLFLLFFSGAVCVAQKQANVWYFSVRSGLDFSSGHPVPLTDGQADHAAWTNLEGTSSICDSAGNLLFYATPEKIWNRNHTLMPNGTNLLGGVSSTQGVLIVPAPGSNTLFYVFTLDDFVRGLKDGLRYSVVDMCLDNGRGDVKPGSKNILLLQGTGEKMAATYHKNGTDIWLVTRKYLTNEFYAYLITASGISAPVVSAIGWGNPSGRIETSIGQMKISPNGKKIAFVAGNQVPGIAQLFDFDNASGIISNLVDLSFDNPLQSPFGLAFSPDNSKLYVDGLTPTGLGQFDLSGSTAISIISSLRSIYVSPGNDVYGMQLANNGKIYVVEQPGSSIGVINFPDKKGDACNYVENAIPSDTRHTLTSFIDGFNYKNGPGLVTCNSLKIKGLGMVCALNSSTTYQLVRNSGCSAKTEWIYDKQSVNAESVTDTSITLSFSKPGAFWVKARIPTDCGLIDSLLVNIAGSMISLGNDKRICPGDSLVLNAGQGFQRYWWEDGSVDSLHVVNRGGTYFVMAENICGDTYTDTVVVDVVDIPNLVATGDTTLCVSDTLTLSALAGMRSYNWQPNPFHSSSTGQTAQYIVRHNGSITIAAISPDGCFVNDSVIIGTMAARPLHLGRDTSFCDSDSITLQAHNGYLNYRWNTGNETSTIFGKQAGLYWVKAQDTNHCFTADTLIVIQVYQKPNVDLGRDFDLCAGVNKQLDAGPFSSFLWQDSSTNRFILATSPGTYWVVVKDHNNCVAADSVTIKNIRDAPSHFLKHTDSICPNEHLNIAATRPFDSYQWSDGSTQPSITANQPGRYILTVKDEFGCIGADSMHIIHKECLTSVFIPTAFTPNADGLNDLFKATVNGKAISFELKIYNRWGVLVFSTSDPAKGWDGFYKGEPQPSGTFVWYCNYHVEEVRTYQQKGTLQLIR
jgi:gliding motility-associated-like protein